MAIWPYPTHGLCSYAYFNILIFGKSEIFVFGNPTSHVFTVVLTISYPKSTFVAGFRVSQPCASVSELPAALRRPQKKHAPGFLECVSCGFCHFNDLRAPQALCVCVAAACGASATSKKTHPWNFGACILWMLSIFVDFRVPPSTPWSMCLPQALCFFFLKKLAPGFPEHVFCVCC